MSCPCAVGHLNHDGHTCGPCSPHLKEGNDRGLFLRMLIGKTIMLVVYCYYCHKHDLRLVVRMKFCSKTVQTWGSAKQNCNVFFFVIMYKGVLCSVNVSILVSV